MKEDRELETDDAWSEGRAYSPKRRGGESGSGRYLRVLLVVILVLIVAGGIFYFLGKRRIGSGAVPLQSKVIALEQRIAGLERQIAELHGKISSSGQDPALLQRVDALWQKVDALEKQKQPAAEAKAKPATPPKSIAASEKKYHTVQKGETLYGISRKYGIREEELRKLNNLAKDPMLRIGQKLLISPER
jgi:LysM repeat protein